MLVCLWMYFFLLSFQELCFESQWFKKRICLLSFITTTGNCATSVANISGLVWFFSLKILHKLQIVTPDKKNCHFDVKRRPWFICDVCIKIVFIALGMKALYFFFCGKCIFNYLCNFCDVLYIAITDLAPIDQSLHSEWLYNYFGMLI